MGSEKIVNFQSLTENVGRFNLKDKTCPRAILATSSTLSHVEQYLPQLCLAFERAVQRGHPPAGHTQAGPTVLMDET